MNNTIFTEKQVKEAYDYFMNWNITDKDIDKMGNTAWCKIIDSDKFKNNVEIGLAKDNGSFKISGYTWDYKGYSDHPQLGGGTAQLDPCWVFAKHIAGAGYNMYKKVGLDYYDKLVGAVAKVQDHITKLWFEGTVVKVFDKIRNEYFYAITDHLNNSFAIENSRDFLKGNQLILSDINGQFIVQHERTKQLNKDKYHKFYVEQQAIARQNEIEFGVEKKQRQRQELKKIVGRQAFSKVRNMSFIVTDDFNEHVKSITPIVLYEDGSKRAMPLSTIYKQLVIENNKNKN